MKTKTTLSEHFENLIENSLKEATYIPLTYTNMNTHLHGLI